VGGSRSGVKEMPIRFRCAFCNQLMGIARRKAGSVVSCPSCQRELVVPTPEQEPVEMPSAPVSVKPGKMNPFERHDFDPAVFEQRPPKPPAAAGTKPTMAAHVHQDFDVLPVDLPMALSEPTAGPRGIPVTTGRLLLLCALASSVLAVVAFAAGFVLGRMR
jgi:phage FluMu protein Com